jgi:hypothetical protein
MKSGMPGNSRPVSGDGGALRLNWQKLTGVNFLASAAGLRLTLVKRVFAAAGSPYAEGLHGDFLAIPLCAKN